MLYPAELRARSGGRHIGRRLRLGNPLCQPFEQREGELDIEGRQGQFGDLFGRVPPDLGARLGHRDPLPSIDSAARGARLGSLIVADEQPVTRSIKVSATVQRIRPI